MPAHVPDDQPVAPGQGFYLAASHLRGCRISVREQNGWAFTENVVVKMNTVAIQAGHGFFNEA
jgi:uncharacterized protein YraI